MPGIDDVARAAGVSTATVSRALSGRGTLSAATRERVIRIAGRLGYVASSSASGLATGRTRTVGVVVPSLTNWFWSTLIEGVEGALRERDYDLALYNTGPVVDERQRIFGHFLLRKRVDAVLAVSLQLAGDEVAGLRGLGRPVVGVGGPLEGLRTVGVDDVAVARLATAHLTALGHRRIGHIAGDDQHDRDFHVPSSRRLGYERALLDVGIEPQRSHVEPGDFTMPGGYRAARALLERERPTAIFAASDEMAFGALLAARDLGLRVPQDLSVVGIDGHANAPFFDLTTVAQHPERQGEVAVGEVLDALERGAPAPGVTLVDVDLEVRGSTAPPAA